MPRKYRPWTYAVVATVGSLAILILPMVFLGGAVAFREHRLLMTGLAALAMAWAMTFTALGFRRQDEFLQQRARIAWYWGGLMGLAVSYPVVFFIGAGGLSGFLQPGAHYDARALVIAFNEGYGLLMVAQLVGFFAVFLYRKATGR